MSAEKCNVEAPSRQIRDGVLRYVLSMVESQLLRAEIVNRFSPRLGE